jgi:hypothetical protein
VIFVNIYKYLRVIDKRYPYHKKAQGYYYVSGSYPHPGKRMLPICGEKFFL